MNQCLDCEAAKGTMGFRVLVLIVTRWAYAGIYNFVSRSYHCNTKLIQGCL
jgi:hypothetical protein